MKLVQRTALRQTQIMAPQLIQSLKMLQVPILKLEQMLRHELAVNPMLEENLTTEDPDADQYKNEEPTSHQDEPGLNKIDWESYFGEDHEYSQPYWSGSFEKTEDKGERTQVFEKNLYEHLNEQLGFTRLSEDEIIIGQYIIGNIDESGFLTCDIPEIAEALSINEEQVWNIVSIIQGFDPAGVCARNLRESLLIQMNNKEMIGTLP
ncbi:MAG: hypothetical protein GY855_03860, partial [candidate division Zixibacteria bacterium]|nr:hypothetical protein [candidate division Zixibacteria bacterium]